MRKKANRIVAGRIHVHLKSIAKGNLMPCKLTNVLHVRNFAFSLRSVGRMADLGLMVTFENRKCILKRESDVVAVGKLPSTYHTVKVRFGR